MARGEKLNEKEKRQIETYSSEGKSLKWIAGMLGRSTDVIRRYLCNLGEYGIKKRTFYKRKLSKQAERLIARKIPGKTLNQENGK